MTQEPIKMTAADSESIKLRVDRFVCVGFSPLINGKTIDVLSDSEQRRWVIESMDAPGMEAFVIVMAFFERWRKRMKDSHAVFQVEVQVGNREMTFGEFVDWLGHNE